MYCPICGCEYREGFTICSDCGETLIAEKVITVEDKKIFAGFFRRFIAFIIDLALCMIVIVPIMYMLFLMVFPEIINRGYSPLLVTLISLIIEVVPTWLYNAFMESSKYEGTIGKIILRIAVVDCQGNRLSFTRSTERFFLKLILSSAIAGFGFIMVAFTKRHQGLHDVLMNTLVIKAGYENELTEHTLMI
ncbi:MAG: RDD family protein [Bacillota bacterium]|nr:RDD family protein [Bacillota bacterium]